MRLNNKKIGIFGLSSQSGMAFFADLLSMNQAVIGYTRPTEHGLQVIQAINDQHGVYLNRPENQNHEESKFLSLNNNIVTNDINPLVSESDLIILALPSHYHVESIRKLYDAGIQPKRIPIILSPSRTFAAPYLWNILGNKYPIACFSTCPYSCKIINNYTSYIKRRKRTWTISIEGDFKIEQLDILTELFPQASITTVPAATSLNNIGAVFHCATFLMNKDIIEDRQKKGAAFSFYMEGIAQRPEVGKILENIDQVRLEIADSIGLETFGLKNNPREEVWRKLTNGLRALEEEHKEDIYILRKIRGQFIEYISNCIISAQHWLDITYGVIRIPGESLSKAIARTPTYQKNSVPQIRYIEEDIPTGLVPLEALARLLEIECSVITNIIDKYDSVYGCTIRKQGRNLQEFDEQYIKNYLLGKI
jgi:hypothetical protein